MGHFRYSLFAPPRCPVRLTVAGRRTIGRNRVRVPKARRNFTEASVKGDSIAGQTAKADAYA
jgi:hypothetical protein